MQTMFKTEFRPEFIDNALFVDQLNVFLIYKKIYILTLLKMLNVMATLLVIFRDIQTKFLQRTVLQKYIKLKDNLIGH